MPVSEKSSILQVNTYRLIAINLVTVLVFISAFYLVNRTFSNISHIFDDQLNKNMQKAVASFEFGKNLVIIEGEVHNSEGAFFHDPEGMVVARQAILGRLDEILYRIKITDSYFSSSEKGKLLREYRLLLANQLDKNVEISETVLKLDLLNQHFLSILQEMEVETGKQIVELVIAGGEPTALHQINALLPFCREQILRARFLMEKAVVDLNPSLLVPLSDRTNQETLASAAELLLITLETLTSATPPIADKAVTIIGDSAQYLQNVKILAQLVRDKNYYHRDFEKASEVIMATLDKVDQQAALTLREIGILTGQEMSRSANWLYLIGGVVLLVSIAGGVTAHIIGRHMVEEVAEKEQTRADLNKQMVQLEEEVELRTQAERQAQELAESLEEQVQERTNELASVNLELESFVYSMSHDLRTPLRGIAGFSNALLEDYGDSLEAPGRRYLQRIQDSSIRMGRTIDEILELSRLSRTKIIEETVNLSEAAEMIIGELRNNHPGRNVHVKVAPGLSVVAAGEQMRAVLESLLENAWKFTAHEAMAEIEFGAITKDNQTTFFVKDNGVGFNMAYSAKMFGAFQRLHLAGEFVGTGIGLALVQRVIRRHGGEVWGEGKEGEGATFYFRI